MDKASLFHLSESIYSFPISDNEIEIRLVTKRDDDILKVELIYNSKYKFHEIVYMKEITNKYCDETHDYYIIRLKLVDLRFAYVFKITTMDNKEYYFSESGITNEYDIKKGFYDFFQVPYINTSDLTLKNTTIQNRVFYQIFIDRFYRSIDNCNPRINMIWGDRVNQNSIAGGNIKGITNKIDYLKDLGIDALYLSPVFESNSNHKYNISDYYTIAKDFGTINDLKSLVDIIHKNDMIIVLDGVFNHISSDNYLFKDVIEKGKKSKYFNWFFIKGDYVDLKKFNYERFADDINMPRLNLNISEVQQYVVDVGAYYIKEYNIDGFRLDVSDEIPHSFWIRFKKEMLKLNPNFFLIGENWHNAHLFLNSGYEFDSIMNYSITKEVLKFIAWEEYTPQKFKNMIVSDLMRYKENINYNLLNLLSSHDIFRFFTECNKDVDKFILGYAFIFTHIGVPCIYYGDEIGLEGNYDPDNRRCFNWDKNKWDMKILSFMKEFIKFHREEKINEMDYNINEKENLVFIKRCGNNKTIELIMNLSGEDKIISRNNIVLKNLYDNGILRNKGFIMIRREKE